MSGSSPARTKRSSRPFRARLSHPAAPAEKRFELLGADREAHRVARSELWEERLQSLATGLGFELERLPAKKSAVEKLWLAAALKHITSVSNGWLATRLQMGAATSVGSLVSSFRSSGGTQSRAFKTALSRFSL